MSIAALKQILAWGIESIQMELTKMTDILIDFKKKTGIFEKDALSAGHLISVKFKNSDSDRIKNKLQEDKVIISFRGSSIRVSPHLYNDKNDIYKLLSCLED